MFPPHTGNHKLGGLQVLINKLKDGRDRDRDRDRDNETSDKKENKSYDRLQVNLLLVRPPGNSIDSNLIRVASCKGQSPVANSFSLSVRANSEQILTRRITRQHRTR